MRLNRRIMINRKKYFIYDEYTANLCKLASNATTTKELAKLCQRMYLADYVNLEGIDLWLAKNAMTAVFQVLRDYPALRRRMHYFGTLNGFITRKDDLIDFLYPDGGDYERDFIKNAATATAESAAESFSQSGLAMAFFAECENVSFSGILIDETDFDKKSVLNNLAYDEASGFSPRGCHSLRSVITHELGHMLDFWLGISECSSFRKKLENLSSSYIQKNLSLYSASGGEADSHEVIAEGFAEYRCSKAPRELATFVGTLIDEKYNGSVTEDD